MGRVKLGEEARATRSEESTVRLRAVQGDETQEAGAIRDVEGTSKGQGFGIGDELDQGRPEEGSLSSTGLCHTTIRRCSVHREWHQPSHYHINGVAELVTLIAEKWCRGLSIK